jgi:hypothetical protein
MTTINNLPILDLAGLSVEAVSIPVVNTTSTTPGATFQLPLSDIAMLAHGDPGYTGSHGEKGDPGIPGYTGSQGMGYTGSAGPIGPPGPEGNPGGYTGSVGLRGYTGSASVGGAVNLSTITQSIIPSSTDIYDLGAGGKVWRGVYTAELYVNPGNIKDLNTGLPIQFNTSNTGTIGPRGYTGSVSTVPGYTGSAGLGYTGSIGPQGFSGYTGSVGPQGYSGSLGIIGYTGSASTATSGVGYAGSRGYTGSGGFSNIIAGSGISVITSGTSIIISVTTSTNNNISAGDVDFGTFDAPAGGTDFGTF